MTVHVGAPEALGRRSSRTPVSEGRVVAVPLGGRLSDLLSSPLPVQGQAILDRFSLASGLRPVIYLSTPITSGWWLLRHARGEAGRSHERAIVSDETRRQVVADNMRCLPVIRQTITLAHPNSYLLDPTELSVPSWTQADYHRFWIAAIESLASEVVFAPRWFYSTGCAIEFVAALRRGLPVYDEALRPLSRSVAGQSLARAAKELSRVGLDQALISEAADFAIAGTQGA